MSDLNEQSPKPPKYEPTAMEKSLSVAMWFIIPLIVLGTILSRFLEAEALERMLRILQWLLQLLTG